MTVFQYWHPLTEVYPPGNGIPEVTLNTWGIASMIVTAAINQPLDGDWEVPEKIFLDAVLSANPDFDARQLLARCRSMDRAAMQQAVALIKEALDQKVDDQLKGKRDD